MGTLRHNRVFKIATFQEQFRIAAMPRSFGYDDLFGAGGSNAAIGLR